MHILWILNGCGLEGRGITGGPVRFHEISRRWTRFGARQSLLTTSGGETMLRGMGCELEDTVVPAAFVLRREPMRFFRLWSYIVTALSWRRRAKKSGLFGETRKPDVVITVSDYFCDIIPALKFKRKTGCKWIAWIHHKETPPALRPGNRLVNALMFKLQEWSFRKIAKFADSAWMYDTEAGDRIRERLLALGMAPEKIRIMKCGVNVAEIKAAPEDAQKEFDAAMIGVRPNKGLFDIIPVWEKVVAQRPSATLCLMGGMSGEGDVVAEIKARGLDENIKVFKPEGGFLPAGRYYAKIKTAKILFAPSHEEGWGIAVCEAMAAGVPVVAYDLPVYRRIYGENFMKTECFDTERFASNIVEMLENDDTQAEYRRRGLVCAERYDWDALAAEDWKSVSLEEGLDDKGRSHSKAFPQ